MFEHMAGQFVGKTVRSVERLPLDPASDIPFAVVVRFTDGSTLRTISTELEGWLEASVPVLYHFGRTLADVMA